MTLDDSVKVLPMVGSSTLERLNVLGIYKIKDLLGYYPKGIEDRSMIRNISDLVPDESNTFKGTVLGSATNIRVRNLKITTLKVGDETGTAEVVFYNQHYLKNTFKEGDEYLFVGKPKKNYNKVQVTSPVFEKIDNKEMIMTGVVVPKYSLTYKLSQKMLRRIIRIALDKINESLLLDYIPASIKKSYGLCDYNYAINNIHFPKDEESFYIARKRLVFQEFFTTQLALTLLKNRVKTVNKGITFKNVSSKEVLDLLPFELTGAQKRVISEIEKDMESDKVMNRLVQGDVGSGKTAVALVAMHKAVRSGYQAVMMAPTEILANQHLEFFKEHFEKIGIRVELLVGSMTQKNKKEVYEKLENHEIDCIIGTHALIQAGVTFKKLGLVVTDEQHRFGVEQRMTLAEKGESPDILVMTATPIPRTLALILYGDLDISIIDELPKGRKPIDTLVVNTSYYDRMYGFVRDEIEKGRQVYIVCPAVEESEKISELTAATEYKAMLLESYLKGMNVELIHGKMKAKDKKDVMDRFMNNEISALVSTTVIEVGISNANATIMIIINAERFGLAQIHQLRGRIGRGEHKSYCILVSDSKTQIAKERLNTIKSTSNGFVIAEKDLELRGSGDFFGTKQHGIPEFRIANLYEDIEVLKDAQMAVRDIIEDDFMLEKEEHKILKKETDEILKYEVL